MFEVKLKSDVRKAGTCDFSALALDTPLVDRYSKLKNNLKLTSLWSRLLNYFIKKVLNLFVFAARTTS